MSDFEDINNFEPSYIVGGMENGVTTLESSLAVPQNVK
jgi:hypothetical protein